MSVSFSAYSWGIPDNKLGCFILKVVSSNAGKCRPCRYSPWRWVKWHTAPRILNLQLALEFSCGDAPFYPSWPCPPCSFLLVTTQTGLFTFTILVVSFFNNLTCHSEQTVLFTTQIYLEFSYKMELLNPVFDCLKWFPSFKDSICFSVKFRMLALGQPI